MNTARIVVVLAMVAGAPSAAASGRLLLEDPSFHATVSSALDCGAPIHLGLTTPDPALLDADTGDAQRVVDAALAAIRFQCPDITRVTVHGSLQGDAEETFIATAHSRGGWMLKPERTFQLSLPPRASGVNRTPLQPSPEAPVLMIAGLEPGMSLDAARAAIAANFGTEPRLYDDGPRLAVEENGCRPGGSWQTRSSGAVAGSRCIEAWFTDTRYPRLYRIEYAEVVTGLQSDDATDGLVHRYGKPAVREDATGRWNSPRATHLAWGQVHTVDGASRHPLEATVTPLRELTVLEISLHEPDTAQTTAPSFRY
ncbi:MAG: hypothetical protein U5S82_17850 [Gammaproteobacteria bacterium]|nr:hypothetical protein [Gammaproteobacteria bacterium]